MLPHCDGRSRAAMCRTAGNMRPARGVQACMKTPPCRWLLAAGHLIVDAVILVLLIAQAATVFRPSRTSAPMSRSSLVLVQEGWDPAYATPPGRFLLLIGGNLPAAVLSTAIRPRAHFQTRSQFWDPVWFLIHETASCAIWFLIGLGIDAGRFRLRREMMIFLAFRAACAALLPAVNIARPAASLEGLFWLALAIWGAGWCVFRLVQRFSSRPRSSGFV